MSNALAELAMRTLRDSIAENRRARERLEGELDDARAELRRLLERSDELGLPRSTFAGLAGLTRTHLYRIVGRPAAEKGD